MDHQLIERPVDLSESTEVKDFDDNPKTTSYYSEETWLYQPVLNNRDTAVLVPITIYKDK